MTVSSKPLIEVTEEDLQALIKDGEVEGKTLEFKGKANPYKESDTGSVIHEVNSFANTHGGDLIIGMLEDENTGRASEIRGISLVNPDKVVSQWDSIVRKGIEPSLPPDTVHVVAVDVEEGGVVLIIRIEQSWRRPHRVKENKEFYGRTSNGKEPLDIAEIRQIFLESEGIDSKEGSSTYRDRIETKIAEIRKQFGDREHHSTFRISSVKDTKSGDRKRGICIRLMDTDSMRIASDLEDIERAIYDDGYNTAWANEAVRWNEEERFIPEGDYLYTGAINVLLIEQGAPRTPGVPEPHRKADTHRNIH